MEELYAEALLWSLGFHDETRYNERLDELFLNDPSNDLYLQLEECSAVSEAATELLARCLEEQAVSFDENVFGARLFSALEAAYATSAATYDELEDFGRRCHRLWRHLPPCVMDREPFLTLVCGDDPLNWGDEGGARKLYETAFAFYGKK